MIVVIGLMVAAVRINFSSNGPEAKLQQESARFAGVFNLAAEYGLLNNVELGLVIHNNSYTFVGYDGVRWSAVPEHDLFNVYQLPDEISVELVFDDLPLEQPSLVQSELFVPDEEQLDKLKSDESDEQAQDKQPIIPQVFILSGGDITPFRAVFSFNPNSDSYRDIAYAVTGLYSTPVSLSGPVTNKAFDKVDGASSAF